MATSYICGSPPKAHNGPTGTAPVPGRGVNSLLSSYHSSAAPAIAAAGRPTVVADETGRQTTRLACTIQPGAIVGVQNGQANTKGLFLAGCR